MLVQSPASFFDHERYGQLARQLRDHAAKLSMSKDGEFTYKLDASGFKPEELTVNVEGDEICVRGHHTETTDGELGIFPLGDWKF